MKILLEDCYDMEKRLGDFVPLAVSMVLLMSADERFFIVCRLVKGWGRVASCSGVFVYAEYTTNKAAA